WVGIEGVGGFMGVVSACRRFNHYERMHHPDAGLIPTVRQLTAQVEGKLIGQSAKLARATAAIIRCEQGLVYLPEGARWVEDFVSELVQFTGLKDARDDQCDVLAFATRELDRYCFEQAPAWVQPEPEAQHDSHAERQPSHAAARGLFGLGGKHANRSSNA